MSTKNFYVLRHNLLEEFLPPPVEWRYLPLTSALPLSYPDREQLQTIYSAYLQPVLQHGLGSQASWASSGRTHQLAGSLVQLYEQVLIEEQGALSGGGSVGRFWLSD